MPLACACSNRHPRKPEIPASISPGWKLSYFHTSAPPQGIPGVGAPECWKAEYGGEGSAEVWLCGYRTSATAFGAVQRARAEAQTVKFQEGSWLVLVKWNNTPKASVTALVRAIQGTLKTAG
jgi:hypothetical protein